MKLSIIVPVYNAEKYLEKCIDSILSQTITDFELILINDGSPDDSQKIIDRYVKKYPEIIKTRTVENGGQGRARNIGIELSSGEFLGFIDSDDWVKPRMYEEMYKAAQRENADVAVCDIEEYYPDGHTSSDGDWKDDNVLYSAGSSCNKIFRRSAVADIRFPEGLWYEDFSFSAKLICKAAKTVHVSENLYVYRLGHESTMNNNNSSKNLDIIKIMDGLRCCCTREQFEYMLINHVLLDTINRVNFQTDPKRKEIIGKLRRYVRENLPDLKNSSSYKNESLNRRVIMRLNYLGMEPLSKLILNTKKSLSK